MEWKALLLTILVSIFFLIGIILPSLFKNKQKLILFTTSLTFVVMLFLLFFDLLPEVIEIFAPFSVKNIFLISIFTLLGFIILKLLDFFIPEHHHEHHELDDDIEEHNAHLYHIGFITSLSLILHNIIEGISIYITGLTDLKSGFLMALIVGCHNLPLGVEISIGLDSKKENNLMKRTMQFLVVFSSFLGAFILFLLGKELHPLFEGILLSMTMGMLLHISFGELFMEIKTNRKKKEIKLGLLFGILLTIVLVLL